MFPEGRSDFIREELIVPKAERGPWYNPHPGSLENAKRAFRPAAITCSLYPLAWVILLFSPSPLWTLQWSGPVLSAAIAIFGLSLSITIFWFMARGSIPAHIFFMGFIPGSLVRISALVSDGYVGLAFTGAAIIAATLVLWLISIIAMTRYIWFRSGKLDL